MFGDLSIPIEQRKDWVWEQLAFVCPEMKRENFPVDDPYALGEIVLNNCYRYKPKIDDVVLDIGANIGIFTMMCALRGATVVAYEPNRWAFQVLVKTMFLNSASSQVHTSRLAVMNYTGECAYHPTRTYPSGDLQTWTSYNGAVNTPGASPDELIECISLEDAIGEREWDCVKMDIEGAEFEILKNAPMATLKRIKYFTIELHNGHVDKKEHDLIVRKLNYVFRVNGIKDGDPLFKDENRYQALFCRRRKRWKRYC